MQELFSKIKWHLFSRQGIETELRHESLSKFFRILTSRAVALTVSCVGAAYHRPSSAATPAAACDGVEQASELPNQRTGRKPK